ncbi:MAG: single-stranded DNA-binding protein [Spirochaetales bacterium]|nr:single-stranded DNA-binding protein [Spirochaetales bacterium]
MANDINHVVLVGRLTRDAELKYTNTGTAISKFSVAVNRRKRSGDQWTDEVSYFDIVLWGKTAETLNQYLQKGKQVAVSGELRQNRWEQEGQNRSKVEVIANNIQLLGGSGKGSDGPARPNNVNAANNGSSMDTGSYSDDFEDDIPF